MHTGICWLSSWGPAQAWVQISLNVRSMQCAQQGRLGGRSVDRSRVKVLETSYQQREEQLRREKEALSAQHASYCQEAEQARAELIAQHQRHLAMAAQEKDQEVARLRELQQ